MVGPAVCLSRWPAALRNLKYARESIHEGYQKVWTTGSNGPHNIDSNS